MIYSFESCTVDTDRYELRCAGTVHPLEPQALDILLYLLEHRDRVVTKHELLDRLWPNRVVGEGILAQRLMTIRKAIGDNGRSQHCIRTLHGRGYRFAAAVQLYPGAQSLGAATSSSNGATDVSDRTDGIGARSAHVLLFRRPEHFVGREAELTELARWWTAAQQGARRVGLVRGEPGIGKTALLDAFLAQTVAARDMPVGRGQCVEEYGSGEPYLPLLEALGRLCHGAEADRFVSSLQRYAPSWLDHLPQVQSLPDGGRQKRKVHSLTPTQMLRELADAVEALTADCPLILVLEDLHWSDRATLAWLAYMARRRDRARILILGTYRAEEIVGHTHPLRALLTKLEPGSGCTELTLEPLSPSIVAAYLNDRCTKWLPASVHEILYRRTGGHPLFLVAMVDELLHEEKGADSYAAALRDLVPENLRQYIEQHVDRLADADRVFVEAASAAGSTFAVATISAGVTQGAETIEASYARLARQGRLLRAAGTEIWPDGTITSCYAFKHALYQEVLYGRVSEGDRVRLHQRIGARRELGYGVQAPKIAAELAVHFARGKDTPRAVQYLYHAANNAMQRSAYQETTALVRQGLELLNHLPEAPERDRAELSLLTTAGLALVATKGQAHADVELTYTRARALCQRLADSAQLFLVLGGLFSCYVVRAKLDAAGEVADELAHLAQRAADTTQQLVAHWALGQVSLFRGELSGALSHLQQGIALYDPAQHHSAGLSAGFPGDLGVFCRCFEAHALWHLGYADRATERMDEALTLAEQLAHPFSRALALAYASMLYQFRREASLSRAAAEAATALCREHGFAYYLAWVIILRGWALTAQAHPEEGISEMQHGLNAIQVTGAKLRRPYHLALLAGARLQQSESDATLALLNVAIGEGRACHELWQEAELHRLRGELFAGSLRDDDEAAQCFHEALDVARAQQSRALELRAATSLARLWRRQGKCVASRALLAPIYGWFTEGFGTADLQEARVLLEEMNVT